MTIINRSSQKLAALAALASTVCGAAVAQEPPPELPFDVIVAPFTEDPAAAYTVAAKRSDWLEAFERQDLDHMMSFYVEDVYSYDLMAAPTTEGLAMAFDGSAIWRDNWVSFFGFFEDDLKVSIENLTVYQSGDIASVRGLTRLEGTMTDGRFVDMWVRETNVLHRVNGDWLVVHDHVSVPIDFMTGEALMNLVPAAQ
jgi:ketosteroid isomerase-like protein